MATGIATGFLFTPPDLDIDLRPRTFHKGSPFHVKKGEPGQVVDHRSSRGQDVESLFSRLVLADMEGYVPPGLILQSQLRIQAESGDLESILYIVI
jgi:hypothetical protein